MRKIFVLTSFLLIININYAQDVWTMIHPYPTLNDLLDTHFVSEDEGWAAGKSGLIIYTDNGGITWDIQHQDSDEMFWSIFFINESEGWVVGWNDIYHTTDKGQTWEKQTRPYVVGDLTDVFFINPDTGWIVGTYKIILKTENGGDDWTRIMNHSASFTGFRSVCFSDELNGIAVGGENFVQGGLVMTTNDGGMTWTNNSPPDCNSFQRVYMIDSLVGWVCGYGSELLKTNNGGISWEDKGSSYYGNYSDILFFNDGRGILLNGTYVRLTFDSGDTWDSIVYFSSESAQNRFSSWEENGIITAGNNGSLCKSLNGGVDWSLINQGMSENIHQIGFLNTDNGYAIAGTSGDVGLYATNDGGYNWSPDTIIQNGPFYRMLIDGESMYFLNASSEMMKSVNSGNDWELIDIPDTTDNYNDMQFIDASTGYLCADNGILVKTSDGGNTWTDKSLSGDFSLRQMFFIDESTGWIVDPVARIIIQITNGGDEWSYTLLGDDYIYQPQSIYFVNANTGFVTTTEGVIFKTHDGGESWEEYYVFNTGTNSSLFFINENEGWYKASSIIYHTYDGGISWTTPQSFAYTHINNMFFLENQGWLCGYNGLVARSSFFVNTDENISNDKTSISIQPNPANDKMEIELSNKLEQIQSIEIFDIIGRSLICERNQYNFNTITIDISTLDPGTHIIHVETTEAKYSKKFIVL